MDRQEWLALRRQGLGGSDAAAVLGLSPWKSAMDVFLEKRGLADEEFNDPTKNFLLDLGLQLEPVIARCYERQTGRVLLLPQENLVHPAHPELRGTPDRMVENELRGVELKTENKYSDQFGEVGSDDVPAHYLIQCAHYMALTGAFHWDIAVLHGGTRFAIYTVERDAELESLLIERLTEWWQRHIVEDVPPDIDASDAWRRYLQKKFPRNIRPIEDIQPGSAHLVSGLGFLHAAQKEIERMRQEYENKLKGIIADRDGVTSRYGRVTWKNTKDTQHVNWQQAFATLGAAARYNAEALQGIVELCTENKPGVRRFLFTPAKGMNYAIERNERVVTDISELTRTLQGGDRAGTPETPGTGEDDAHRADHLPAHPATKPL